MYTQPIILLTFSNNEDAYLPMIVAEQKAIKKALLNFADKNYLQLRDIQRVSTKEVFYLINRYHNRVQVLHYAGHASGQTLQLEKEIGIVQSANVKGIAGLLGTQKALKLVFLNGCATKGQVKSLLDSGVGAVIATSVKIKDNEAQLFATQFYEALGTGSSIRESFLKAKAALETGSSNYQVYSIDETRGRDLSDFKKDDDIPWGLYWKAEQAEVLDWTLPTQSPLEVDFGGDAIADNVTNTINSMLVDRTLKAVKDSVFVKELARKIYRERQEGNTNRKPTDAEKKDAVIRSFPAPLSVHIRALFSDQLSKQYDELRLQQLLWTYEQSLAFFAFTMLSNIWDATIKQNKALDIAEEELLQIRAFFDLNAHTNTDFDYFYLADALLKLAKRNNISFYLHQLNDYEKGWDTEEVFENAQQYFKLIKTALEADVPSRLIAPYCIESERQLTNLLCEWHYLLHYKMVVVKNIEVQQIRNIPPTCFKHVIVDLGHTYNISGGSNDRWQAFENPTDMESILLYKDNVEDSLNLSPFILDKNALTRQVNSKIHFFSYASEETLQFYWIENIKDTLSISKGKHEYVLQQFKKARQDILREKVSTESPKMAIDEDDITSLL